MSEYQQFLSERDKIDYYLQQGYVINNVFEHLNGASVEFLQNDNQTKVVLEIGNANARKYFSTLLFQKSVKA